MAVMFRWRFLGLDQLAGAGGLRSLGQSEVCRRIVAAGHEAVGVAGGTVGVEVRTKHNMFEPSTVSHYSLDQGYEVAL